MNHESFAIQEFSKVTQNILIEFSRERSTITTCCDALIFDNDLMARIITTKKWPPLHSYR